MDYLNLMRVKHYIKNLLIFIPLFFNKNIFNVNKLADAFIGFCCFCLVSSAVYIINDLKDVEKDKNHPKKKNRPIASGKVSKKSALLLMCACLFITVIISVFFCVKESILLLMLYFCLNVAYSLGLKNYPITDVVILSSGFVIRVIYGGILTNIEISNWLYLLMFSGSLFMGLGKRRNELKKQNNTRAVLKYYNDRFLDKNMYVAATLVIIFYALWSIELTNPLMVWTVPYFMIIIMKYSYDIEGDSDADPVEVLLHDKILILLTLFYIICVFVLLYFFK